MKLFGFQRKNNKRKFYFLFVPIFKAVKEQYCEKYYLFGIKLPNNNLKKELLETKKEISDIKNELKAITNYFFDIENIPKAKGVLRTFQLVALKILKNIDSVCKDIDISYFALYGTLLGAVRHKGFIPWDDDLDIVMERNEFEKFFDACKNGLLDNNLSYYHWSNTEYNVLKIILKVPNTPLELCPFVDIHAFDTYLGNINDSKYNEIVDKILNAAQMVNLIPINDIEKQQADIISNINKLKEYSKKHILNDIKDGDKEINKYLCMGVEFPLPNLACLKYEDVFPLTKLKFEDFEIFVPKNYEKFLYNNYGDYMRPHIDGDMYHFNNNKYTYEQINYMKNFVCETGGVYD